MAKASTIKKMLATRKRNAELRAAGLEAPGSRAKTVTTELPLDAIPDRAPKRGPYQKAEYNYPLIARLIIAIAKEMK